MADKDPNGYAYLTYRQIAAIVENVSLVSYCYSVSYYRLFA